MQRSLDCFFFASHIPEASFQILKALSHHARSEFGGCRRLTCVQVLGREGRLFRALLSQGFVPTRLTIFVWTRTSVAGVIDRRVIQIANVYGVLLLTHWTLVVDRVKGIACVAQWVVAIGRNRGVPLYTKDGCDAFTALLHAGITLIDELRVLLRLTILNRWSRNWTSSMNRA